MKCEIFSTFTWYQSVDPHASETKLPQLFSMVDTDSTSVIQTISTTNSSVGQGTQTLIDQVMSIPSINPSDPLFIHASDHPGMMLVPKVLDGTNYAIWRRSMLVSLSAKNKLGFIK